MKIKRRKELLTVKGIILCEYLCEEGNYYGIEKRGKERYVVIDYDSDVLERLYEELQRATIQFYVSGKMKIRWQRDGKIVEMPIARYLYCLYNDVDKNELIGCVLHRKDNKESIIEDCRSSNLYYRSANIYKESRRNSENVQILESIVVESNLYGYKEMFDDESVIIDILERPEMTIEWGNTSNRVLCTVRGTALRFPVSYLAFLAYYADITVDNYVSVIRNFKQYTKEHRLSVEHLDGDYHNHRKYNLALVPEGLNSRKSNKIDRVIEPYCFLIVRSNGKFKIAVGKLDENTLAYNLFITADFKNVVDLLDEYMKMNPENIYKVKDENKNAWIFRDAVVCKALADTPESRFKSLDDM